MRRWPIPLKLILGIVLLFFGFAGLYSLVLDFSTTRHSSGRTITEQEGAMLLIRMGLLIPLWPGYILVCSSARRVYEQFAAGREEA